MDEVLPWSLQWWHIIGGLVSLSLAILSLVLRGWSKVVRDIKEEWGARFDHFSAMLDQHEQRLEDSIVMLHHTHLEIVNRVAKIEGILSTKRHWPLRDED